MLPSVKLFLFCGEALPCDGRQAPRAFSACHCGEHVWPNGIDRGRDVLRDRGKPNLRATRLLPAGAPRPGTEIRICDLETESRARPAIRGEIVIVGNTVAKGYYRNPEKTQKGVFAIVAL